MKVHFDESANRVAEIECEAVVEGDHGLYLMSHPNDNMSNQIGYVPYERLRYVEPPD